jgi:hypothetical protein
MTFTDHDMRDQVKASLTGEADHYDVPAIVDELQARYGTVSIETMDTAWYWTVVLRHCTDPDAASNTEFSAG